MSDTPRNDHDHDARGRHDEHPSDERLRAHLDGALGPEEDTEVAGHLDVCAACTARLDAFEAPPVLAAAVPAGQTDDAPAWDERRMRRSVRRTLLRTAWNAALLLVAVAITLQLLGWFVLQPVLVARGDRLATTIIATMDVPIMTTPGAELTEIRSMPGILRRTTEASFDRFVGSRSTHLGSLTTRLGPIGTSTPYTSWPALSYGSLRGLDGSRVGPVDQSPVPFEPDRLAAGTAVTVQVAWDTPIARPDAQAIAGTSDEVALLWVGFEVPGTPRVQFSEPGSPVHDGAPLGYSACGTIARVPLDYSRLGGFDASGGFRDWEVAGNGVEHALEQLRRATTNLAATDWPDGRRSDAELPDPMATADALRTGDPQVTSLVVTGPLDAVAAVVAAADADPTSLADAYLYEIDFDRSAPDPCG
jgi:hypothetical protein